MKTNTSNKTDINTLKNRKEKTNMKTTSIKMIIALALALTLVCALGTSAFADFMSPYGYVTINIDGSRTLYLDDGTRITRFPDGSIVSFDPRTGETIYSDDRFSATTFYADGSYSYQNGNGYSEYHDSFGYGMTEYADGTYDVEENGILTHYDRFGNVTSVQVNNGMYYETIF